MIKAIAADGIDLKSLSKTELNKVGDDAHAMLKKFEQEIEQLLTDNMESLKSLANSLQKEHTLSIKQIMDIVAKPEAPVAIPAAA
jgi:hypothetical protein